MGVRLAQRKVRDQGLPSVRVTEKQDIGAFGGGVQIADELKQITSGISQIVLEEQKKAQDTQFRQLEAEEIAYKNNSLYNKDTGYLKTRGNQANENFGKYSKEYDDFIAGQQKTITNSKVRDAYKVYITKSKSQFSAQMNRHAGGEMQKQEIATGEALVARLKEDSILRYSEPPVVDAEGNETGVIRSNIERQSNVIQKIGESQGMSASQIHNMKLQSSSGTHEGVINKMANAGTDKDARTYFENAKSRNEIDARTVARLEKTLHVSDIRGEARRNTDKIMDDMLMKGWDKGTALAEVRKIKDTEVMDATKKRVENRISENRVIEKEREKEKFGSLIDEANRTKTSDGMPSEEIAALTTKKRNVINKVLGYIAKGQEPPNNPEVFYDLMLSAGNPKTKDSFLRTDINMHAHELSNRNREKLIAMQKSLRERKGKGTDEANLRGYLTDAGVVKNALGERQITNKKTIATFNDMVNEKTIEWKERNGKKHMPQDDFKVMVDTMLTEVETPGFIFDTTKRVFELEPNETVNQIKFESIPQKDIEKIKAVLLKRNRPYNETAAVQMYQNKLSRVRN